MLYAKSLNHAFITYQAIGKAIIADKPTSMTKSLDSKTIMFITPDPRTFLIPISLIRRFAINEINPNIPKQEIKMVNSATTFTVFSIPSINLYWALTLSVKSFCS